jgi:hypothetical protein
MSDHTGWQGDQSPKNCVYTRNAGLPEEDNEGRQFPLRDVADHWVMKFRPSGLRAARF